MTQIIKSLIPSDSDGNLNIGRPISIGGSFFFPCGKNGIIAIGVSESGNLSEIGRFGSRNPSFPNAELDPLGKNVNFVDAQNSNGYILCSEITRGDAYLLSRSLDDGLENISYQIPIIYPRGEEEGIRERLEETSFCISISNTEKVIFYFSDKLRTFLDYNNPGDYQFKLYTQKINHQEADIISYDAMNKSGSNLRNISEASLRIDSKTQDENSIFFNYFPPSLSSSEFFFNDICPINFLHFVKDGDVFFCFRLNLSKGGNNFSSLNNDIFFGKYDSSEDSIILGKTTIGTNQTFSAKKINAIFEKDGHIYLCLESNDLLIFETNSFGSQQPTSQKFRPSPLTEEFVLDICETYKGLTAIVNSLGSTIVRVFGQNNDGTLHKISDEIIPMKIMKKMYYDSSSETIMMNSEKEIYAYINKSIEIPTTGPGIREWVDRYPYDRTGWYTCYIHRRPNWVSGNFGYVRSRGDGETEFSISGLFSPVAADPYVAPEDVDVTPGIHPKYSSSSFKLLFEKLLRGKRGILRGMDLREDGSDIYIGSGSMFIVDQIHISEAEFGPINMPLPAIENSFIYYDPGTENFYFVQSGNESGLCVVLRYNSGKWMNTPKLLLNRKITTPKPGKVFLTTDWEVHLK